MMYSYLVFLYRKIQLAKNNHDAFIDNIFENPEALEKGKMWLMKNNIYVLKLNFKDKFTLRGYTYKGDRIANTFCLHYQNEPEKEFGKDFIKFIKTVPSDCRKEREFICYFFQFQTTIKKYFENNQIKGAFHYKVKEFYFKLFESKKDILDQELKHKVEKLFDK